MVVQPFHEYEFNQIETIKVNPAVIADLWGKAKEAVNSYAIASLEPYKGIEGEISGMARQTTYDILKDLVKHKLPIKAAERGGSKRRTNKRRTNKRRTNKRRTNKRRTNNRRTKRRKTKRRRTNNKRKSRRSRRI
jgi:hypothetical protein